MEVVVRVGAAAATAVLVAVRVAVRAAVATAVVVAVRVAVRAAVARVGVAMAEATAMAVAATVVGRVEVAKVVVAVGLRVKVPQAVVELVVELEKAVTEEQQVVVSLGWRMAASGTLGMRHGIPSTPVCQCASNCSAL